MATLLVFVTVILSLIQPLFCVPVEQEIFKWMADNKSCREIGEKCSNKYTKDECCDSDATIGNMQCKYDKTNKLSTKPRRFETGICCFKTERFGCSIDTECCDENAFCDLNGKCKIGVKYLDLYSSSKANANSNTMNHLENNNNDDDLVQNEKLDTEIIKNKEEIEMEDQHFIKKIKLTPHVIGVLCMVLVVITICSGMYIFVIRKESQNQEVASGV